MSFGNKLVNRSTAVLVAGAIVTTSLFFAVHLKAAANCTGPTFDAGSKTLSLVCTESDEQHQLSCSDVTNPDILSLTVNGQNETLTCPLDTPPNALPTVGITGPNTGDWGVNYTFTVTGTDADVANTLVYHVDWDNDGIQDFVSGSVSSGTGVNVARSWAALGAQTFQARAVDNNGGMSPWVSHTITISNPPPATATLTVRVNGGGWSGSNQTVDATDLVELRWDSTQADSCSASGSGFSAAATSGTDPVPTPSPNTSVTFRVTCTGPGGSGWDELVVTTRELPNLSVTLGTPQPTGFNQATGMYATVGIPFQVINNGGSNIATNPSYEFQFDQGQNGYDFTANGNLGALSVGQIFSHTQSLSNVPFGNHRVRVHADNTDSVDETDNADNIRTLDFSLPPSDPGLSITANPPRVQNGQSTTIAWTMSGSYPMNCSVFGPGMVTRNFNPTIDGPNGNTVVNSITAKSEYTLRCVEPVTNTVFTDTVTVETQGVIEEI